MKNLINFLIVCFWVLGTIGGIGYAIYGGSWPIAVGVAVLGVLSFPTLRKAIKELMG